MEFDKADLARWLMRQAGALSPDQRRDFRKFIAEQVPKRGKKRKVHSWRKAKSIPKAPRARAQLKLDLGNP